MNQRTFDFLHKYKEKYIDTGSIKPLTDTMIGLFFFSYAVAWPQVRHLPCMRHIKSFGTFSPNALFHNTMRISPAVLVQRMTIRVS